MWVQDTFTLLSLVGWQFLIWLKQYGLWPICLVFRFLILAPRVWLSWQWRSLERHKIAFIYTEQNNIRVIFDTRGWGGSDPAYFKSAFMRHCVFPQNFEQTQSRFRAALTRCVKMPIETVKGEKLKITLILFSQSVTTVGAESSETYRNWSWI